MANKTYSPPLDKLLALGESPAETGQEWPDYVRMLDLNSGHIPELIRMATDEDLRYGDEEAVEDISYWGPVHAWRALGQLKALEAAKPLTRMFDWEDELTSEEMPQIFAMIGPETIPVLAAYLADNSEEDYPSLTPITCLEKIVARYPESCDQVIAVITQQLEQYRDNNPEINAWLVSTLTGLKAESALPLIEEAFEAEGVSFDIIDWNYVQYKFGLIAEEQFLEQNEKDNARRRAMQLVKTTPGISSDEKRKPAGISGNLYKARAKAKVKRKMTKESRKKNRKKK